MTDEKVQKYLSCFQRLKSLRNNNDNYWQQVADYTLPRRDFNTTRTPGEQRNIQIFDSTAIETTMQLASGLHGMLTPMWMKFFFLRLQGIEETDVARRWLDHVAERIFFNFTAPSSLFASQVHELYLDLVAFGQGTMLCTYEGGQIKYRTKHLNKSWICENDKGVIDMLYYRDEYYPVEIVRMCKEWRTPVPKIIQEAYEKGQDIRFPILYAVEPRDNNYGPGAIKTKKPFAAVYICETSKTILKEDGYDEFPYMVPRFSKRSGEMYGYGPGMDALPEVKQLNHFTEVMFRAASKNADPPILSPVEGVVLPLRLDPNGINYYNPDVGTPEFWSNGFRPDYFENLLETKRGVVRSMYFVNWMNLQQQPNMTATEVIQRTQESLRLLSPMLARLEAEFLSPLISRTYNLMVEHGMVDPAPEEIRGAPIVIEYCSPIAQAQRSAGINQVMQALNLQIALANTDQSVINVFNGKKILTDVALNVLNLSADYLNTDEDIAAMEHQQQMAQANAATSQIAETYSKALKNTAGAAKELQGV